MLRKTVKEYRRKVVSGYNFGKEDTHIERVYVETWWFLFIPAYSRESIVFSTL